MRDALTGKVAIVTGASRGIGAAIARRYAAEGARVAIVARSLEPGSGGHLAGSLQEVATAIGADGGVALPLVADLSDPACDRAALVERVAVELGPVDVLVNNAAACFYLSIDDTSERRLRVAYEVNAITPYLLAKAAVPSMRERGAGWIVNIATVIADPAGPGVKRGAEFARASTYAPSKASLNLLTQTLAAELGPSGIAVNAVAPEMAVATEGATAVMDLPEEWLEPIEALAEASLAFATCDPAQENGLVVKSLSYLRERARPMRTLDGRELFACEPGADPEARTVECGSTGDRGPEVAAAMSGGLDGRIALVTGGASGIGRATALVLAEQGASVVIADVNEDGALETAALIDAPDRVGVVAADVTDADAVDGMVAFAVERFGRLDCACNVAGISVEPKPFIDHTLAEWQRVIDVDLTGVFACMQAELRQMISQDAGGAIVNVSSGAGVVPAPGQPHYTAAKHAVLGLTKHAAQEYARSGIRVNAVLPGQTETEPMKAYLDAQPDGGARLLSRMPMGRMAQPREIAESIAWLCSDASSYVNGVSLLVDGGQIAR